MFETDKRRPLKTRGNSLARAAARSISRKNITPNQISILSIACAAFAAYFILQSVNALNRNLYLVGAAIFIQLRLLCNMLDGMVAVEGGKGTESGELFNEIPDRIDDILIITSLGYAINLHSYDAALGWLAALLAVMTAYVRALGTSVGAPCNFTGPMAKPHRMALITLACLVSCYESAFWAQGTVFFVTLIILIAGTALTVYRRTLSTYQFLERKND